MYVVKEKKKVKLKMSSVEVVPVVEPVPTVLEGGEYKRKACKKGRSRSRLTNRCRKPCPAACKGEFYESESEEPLTMNASPERVMLGPLRENGMFGGKRRRHHKMRGGESEATDAGIEGGEAIEGGKRKLTAYNKFVRSFHMKHRSLKGKSFIRKAAAAWRSRSRSTKRKSHSRR